MKNPVKKRIYEVTMTPAMNDLLRFLGEYVYTYGNNNSPKIQITVLNKKGVIIEYPNYKNESIKFRVSMKALYEFSLLNTLFSSMIK